MIARPKPLFDSRIVSDAVKLLIEAGQVVELRLFEARFKGERSQPSIISGYFADHEKIVSELERIQSAQSVCFTPNAVDTSLLARAANRLKRPSKNTSTNDTNIVRRKWLLVDIDPKRVSDISSSDAEHESAIAKAREIRDYLSGTGFPEAVFADSGNGAHLLYRIDEPTNDNGLIERCVKALASRFNSESLKVDESVFNPSRVWKLYGTLACKGDDIPDRPHRMSRILSKPSELQIVSTELLESLAAEAPIEQPPQRQSSQRGDNRPSGNVELVEQFIRRYGLQVRQQQTWNSNSGKGVKWLFEQSPLCDHRAPDAFIGVRADGAIVAQCSHNSCSWKWEDLREKFDPKDQRQRQQVRVAERHEVDEREALEADHLDTFQQFPLEMLPNPVRSFVDEHSNAIGCDPTYIILPALAGIASTIGNSRQACARDGWIEPAIIWSIVVGFSGTMKSPAIKRALTPIFDLEKLGKSKYNLELQDKAIEFQRYKRDLAKWEKSNDNSDPPRPPEELIRDRFYTSDFTIESLTPLLSRKPRGILLYSDELAGMFARMDKYSGAKGSDAVQLMEAYDAHSIQVDRKGSGEFRGQGNTFVPRAYVSITGGIQPRTLEKYFTADNRASGLAARFLLTCPPRKPDEWREAKADARTTNQYRLLYDGLLKLQPMKSDDGLTEPVDVSLSRGAIGELADFVNEHGKLALGLNEDRTAAWAKLKGAAVRIALIVHCIRVATYDSAITNEFEIDKASMLAGIGMARWFRNEANRVYDMLDASDQQKRSMQLIEFLRRHGGKATIRDVQKGLYRHHPGKAEKELNSLAKSGFGRWIKSEIDSNGGRPTDYFQLNLCDPLPRNSLNQGSFEGFGEQKPPDLESFGDTPTESQDGNWRFDL